MLELEEFPRAVRRLSERHDPRVADDRAKRLEILPALPRLHGGKRDRRRSDPFDDGLIRIPRLRSLWCHGLSGFQQEYLGGVEQPGDQLRKVGWGQPGLFRGGVFPRVGSGARGFWKSLNVRNPGAPRAVRKAPANPTPRTADATYALGAIRTLKATGAI